MKWKLILPANILDIHILLKKKKLGKWEALTLGALNEQALIESLCYMHEGKLSSGMSMAASCSVHFAYSLPKAAQGLEIRRGGNEGMSCKALAGTCLLSRWNKERMWPELRFIHLLFVCKFSELKQTFEI